ncbi:MAG TPA: helix-turn-helix transcriptional regulator [Longilinea sp.]|nr:helix-turn-helix transcriptional regulator [Longilinea sp.]
MDIRFTILGLLNWQSLSGYDLKRIIADSDLFYWSGNNNQIYNVLVDLHKQGYVSQVIQYQESLPAKKIYSITPAGQAELRAWLRSDPELPEFRNNFLIQLAWMDELSGDELDACLARYAQEIAIQLQMRQAQIERSSNIPNRTPRERFLWTRINENLVNTYRQELEWVTRLQSDLKKQTNST